MTKLAFVIRGFVIRISSLTTRSILAVVILGCIAALPNEALAATRLINTEFYRLHTDLDDAFARDIARRLDLTYREYARRLSGLGGSIERGKRYEVHVFARKIDYMKFTGDRFPNSGGVFMSATNTLAAFCEDQPDQLRATLQHEGFHQFAWTHIGPNLPVWLNEGLAVLFGEAIVCGEQMSLGQVPPWRLRQLNADMDARRLVDFKSFVAITDEQWASRMHEKSASVRQYNQAWAMAQFLVFATDDRGNLLFRDRLIAMLRSLREGMGASGAFEKHFSTNYAGFQDRFVAWAKTLQPTSAATYIERQQMLANMLILLREYNLSPSDADEFRALLEKYNCRLETTRGDVKYLSDANPATYFADLEGRDYQRDRLYFERRSSAPAPDLVCKPTANYVIRTRFYETGGKLSHETIVEP